MKFPRRHFLQLATGAASIGLFPQESAAACGSGRLSDTAGACDRTDLRPVARPTSSRASSGNTCRKSSLSPSLSTTASAPAVSVATEYVVKSPPDGYTLLVAISSNAINATLFNNLNFNFIRDTTPVAFFGSIPLVVEVTPSFPGANRFRSSSPICKAQSRQGHHGPPGGTGAPAHVAEAMARMMADVKMTHVPYRGEGACAART